MVACNLQIIILFVGKDAKVKGLAAPSNLSMNQTLEGHSGRPFSILDINQMKENSTINVGDTVKE